MRLMSHKRRRPHYRWMAVHLVLLVAVVIAGWFVTGYLGDRARREILEENEATTLLLTTHLTDELKTIEGAVKAMAGSPWIISALISREGEDIAHANSALDRYNSALDVSVSYLMDVHGITIASSNRNDPDSFVGKSYQFRPYFTQAVTGNPSRYFALGITSLKRGFYASFPVGDYEGAIIGVVVMKRDLDGMELQLRNYAYCFFVNQHGIIFLSSDPELVMKSLWPVAQATEKELLTSKQFGERPFDAVMQNEAKDRTEVLLRGNTYLTSRKVINPEGWSLVLMTKTDRVTIYKSVGVILTLIVCLLITIPFAMMYQTIKSAEVMRRSEERFEQVAQSSQDWIWETDRDGLYTYSSMAVKHILGYEPEEIIGKHYYDFYVPEEKELLRHTFKGFFDRKDFFFRVVNRRVHRDGHQVFVESTGVPLLDEEGRAIGYRGTNHDITDRKSAEEEKEKLEKVLLQAQKMEAVGTLAGGIAHDFNNLLMGIQGYTSLMLLTTDGNHPNYNKLKRIEEQVESGADLTAQLLGFARGGRYEITPTDLNALIKSTSNMFGRTKKEILIHEKLREDLWPVEVDQGQIEQVLLNLYVNAWQAMLKGGDLYLETDNIILDENYMKHFSVVPGRYVKISVTDSGIGMDEKTQQRIFEPFFTTKKMGRGTGLGLATVYGIIKGHQGIINVYSERGHGTTFTIYLPASEKKVTQERKVPESILKGHETILLVDDEEVIAAVTGEILESLGYNVLAARSGREAIEIYKATWEKIALVILDMIMPEIGGGETFDHLKEINPDVKVILSSGYSLSGQAVKIMEKGCYAFIQKPFTVMSLSQKIREVLDDVM